jgi:hypothetical protein
MGSCPQACRAYQIAVKCDPAGNNAKCDSLSLSLSIYPHIPLLAIEGFSSFVFWRLIDGESLLIGQKEEHSDWIDLEMHYHSVPMAACTSCPAITQNITNLPLRAVMV